MRYEETGYYYNNSANQTLESQKSGQERSRSNNWRVAAVCPVTWNAVLYSYGTTLLHWNLGNRLKVKGKERR